VVGRPPRLVARVAAGSAIALAGVLGAGCSAVSELIQLEERIERAGYEVESTFHDDFGTSTNEVQVEANTGRGQDPPEGNDEIAGIVWETYPRRFDRVFVRLDGTDQLYSRAQLQEQFGVRDARLDEREFGDDIQEGIRSVAIGAAVVIGIGLVAIVVTVVMLRRRRSKNPPPPPGFGSGYGPGHGSPGWYPPPPPPGPPPGWQPPPPPPSPSPPPPPSGYPPPPPGPIR
jgi:hypothetical protein